MLAGAHPRVCGATALEEDIAGLAEGPSPRVRGNRVQAAVSGHAQGPIPACAGQPRVISVSRSPIKAHPRVCGATPLDFIACLLGNGPSPRVRGNLQELDTHRHKGGPIPACAGQPWSCPFASQSAWAHPRVCGATGKRSPM